MKHSLPTLLGLALANFLSIWLFDITVGTALERSFFQLVAVYALYVSNKRED